jgi:hypothetical protein
MTVYEFILISVVVWFIIFSIVNRICTCIERCAWKRNNVVKDLYSKEVDKKEEK